MNNRELDCLAILIGVLALVCVCICGLLAFLVPVGAPPF